MPTVFQVDAKEFGAAMKRLEIVSPSVRRRVFGEYSNYLLQSVRGCAPFGRGNLRNSFKAAFSDDHAVVGSGLAYARILHYGGTVRASGNPLYKAPGPPLKSRAGSLSEVTGKPIKFLAIPLPGARRNSAPIDYPNSFVYRSKRGKLIIAEAAGKSLRFLFVLKESIEIRATGYMKPTDKDIRQFGVEVVRGLNAAVKG